MNVNPKLLDQVRSRSSELENETIDEFVAGRLSRRDFLRRGSVIGLSATSMGAVLAACGNANNTGGGSSSSAVERHRHRQPLGQRRREGERDPAGRQPGAGGGDQPDHDR